MLLLNMELPCWQGGHDAQLNQIYEAIENLLDQKAEIIKWEDRQRIGFNKSE